MGVTFSRGRTINYMRWMAFVDGTNFLCHLSEELSIPFKAEKPPPVSLKVATTLINHICRDKLGPGKVRNYWFSSYQGNDECRDKLARELRKNDFEPVLFQRRDGREKGVDIALAKEMLVNAFNQNFDIGILIAGDEDYVGLVNEVKRYGPVIYGAFFSSHGLAENLRIACDKFFDIIKDNRIVIDSADYKNIVEELRKS